MNCHPFTEATLAVVTRKLDNAIALLEEYAETSGEGIQDVEMNFSRGYRELLQMRGLLKSAEQLEEMKAAIKVAKAERPKLTLAVAK